MRQIPIALQLLRSLVRDVGGLSLSDVSPAELDWATRAGLAPLLHFATAHGDAGRFVNALLAGDLSARVMAGSQQDAMAAILEAAGPKASRITLLKGMALVTDVYPLPHQRTMGDIDVLVAIQDQAWLEALLTELGYQQRSHLPAAFYASHSHSMPFVHPHLPLCIEVHTALFPPHLEVAKAPAFAPLAVLHQRCAGEFRGHPVQRLRPELALAYLCAHMAERLTLSREPLACIDAVMLLRKYGGSFDWDWLLDGVAGTLAGNHVNVLLTYLHTRGLIEVPEAVLRSLADGSGALGPTSLKLLHGIMESYLLQPPLFRGVVTDWTLRIAWDTLLRRRPEWINLLQIPWNAVFIPNHAERYSLRFHWWRLRSWLRRRWT